VFAPGAEKYLAQFAPVLAVEHGSGGCPVEAEH
jgi:hypothetical protein